MFLTSYLLQILFPTKFYMTSQKDHCGVSQNVLTFPDSCKNINLNYILINKILHN